MTEAQETLPIERSHSCRIWLALAVAVAATYLVMLAAWVATDASFRMATWKARVALRLEAVSLNDPELAEAIGLTDAIRDVKWDPLGKRVIAFCILIGIGITATVYACCVTPWRFSVTRLTACAMLLAGWAVLYCTQEGISDWRAQRQVTNLLPRFQLAGNALHDHWPTQSGEIPPDIKFGMIPANNPNVLMIRSPGKPWPMHEDLGLTVTRGDNGIIRFDLRAAADSCVEFHPNGTHPAPYSSAFGYPSPPVAAVTPLKDNWYLVRYGH